MAKKPRAGVAIYWKTEFKSSVATKEHCVKDTFRLASLFHGRRDLCGGKGDAHCQMRTKNVLVKKVVAGPPEKKCVLKDAAAASAMR